MELNFEDLNFPDRAIEICICKKCLFRNDLAFETMMDLDRKYFYLWDANEVLKREIIEILKREPQKPWWKRLWL